jgi:hypothetical protein
MPSHAAAKYTLSILAKILLRTSPKNSDDRDVGLYIDLVYRRFSPLRVGIFNYDTNLDS